MQLNLHRPVITAALSATLMLAAMAGATANEAVQVGPRPYFIIEQMQDGALKEKLRSCASGPFTKTLFSIGHRGAGLMFPEHTVESYRAAARMGAGIVECDVSFTKDHELVCRHAHNDLHTTTNILATDLVGKCATPFTAASADTNATAQCRTNDITLAEFQSLEGKMDAANSKATTVDEYMNGTANWRTDLYAASSGTLMTHAQSIELFRTLGVKFTPELKTPAVTMPVDGFSQEDFAQKMIDEYKSAGVPASDVWAQSFNLADVLYWIENEPEFGKQAVYLDGRYGNEGFDPMNPETFEPSMSALKNMGVNYIAPPTWMLVTLKNGKITPSAYANDAKAAGLTLITWTLERSGPLANGGGWYFQSITDTTNNDGVAFELLDVLAKDIGVVGVFSDWPATVTYYASCMDLK